MVGVSEKPMIKPGDGGMITTTILYFLVLPVICVSYHTIDLKVVFELVGTGIGRNQHAGHCQCNQIFHIRTSDKKLIRVDLAVSALFLINAFDNRTSILTRSAKVEKKL